MSDFIEKINLITQENINDKKWSSENESITAEQMILLQEYRRDFLREFDNQFMPSSTILLKLFLETNAVKKLGTKVKLKTQIKQAILLNNRESIVSANKILSGQSKLNPGDLEEDPTLPASWNEKRFTKAKDILSAFDKETYQTLKKVIVEYNKSLKPGLKKYLSAFDDDKAKETSSKNLLQIPGIKRLLFSRTIKAIQRLARTGHVYALKNLLKPIDSTKAKQAQ